MAVHPWAQEFLYALQIVQGLIRWPYKAFKGLDRPFYKSSYKALEKGVYKQWIRRGRTDLLRLR